MHPLILQYISSNRFGEFLGMDFSILAPGEIIYQLPVKNHHLATPQAVHGGVIAALMDALLGVCALSAVCDQNRVVATVEFKLNFIAPAFNGDLLEGIAKTEHKGGRIIVVSGDIVAKNRNQLIAKGIGTFNAYPAEKAGYQ